MPQDLLLITSFLVIMFEGSCRDQGRQVGEPFTDKFEKSYLLLVEETFYQGCGQV